MDAGDLDNDGRRDINVAAWPRVRPPIARDPALEARLERILAGMSLEEKVGQVIQADIGSVTPADVGDYHLGSVLNGGNSAPGGVMNAAPSEWLALADAFWEASMPSGAKVPIIWGTDAIHGNSNVAGATIFPHAINLGAARNVGLVERIGAATALEMTATGLDWTYAPTLAVVQDVRWGRTFESFSADPTLVGELGAALIRGLQGEVGGPGFLGPGKVLATAKHFVGDGGSRDGLDQGDTEASEAELRDIHAAGYVHAIAAGVQSVMASFSSWGERKLHGRADLLSGLLKQHWGFDGVVVGDWNGHGQLPGATAERSPDALLAGLDVYMAPDSWRGMFASTLDALRANLIPLARLDDAVRRVLRLKLRARLFDKPKPSARPFAGRFDLLSCEAHLELAREAVRKSAVLLKNHDAMLPLRANQHVLIAGAAADDLSTQCGGWTLSWQGQNLKQSDFPKSETLQQGVARVVVAAGGSIEHAADRRWPRRPDVAIVVFGEEPYAEFRGDLETLDYKPGDSTDYDILRKLHAEGIPTVAVFYSGRPLWVNPALNHCGAFVAAFLPGTQAGALADLLFSDTPDKPRFDFLGRLPFAWPINADQFKPGLGNGERALFPMGFGLSLKRRSRLRRLHERAVATGVDPHTLFNLGAARGGWSLLAEDAQGASSAEAPAFTSPGGAVRVHATDLGQQENAIAIAWLGDARGGIAFRHAPLDLRRDANAGCCIALQFRAPHQGELRFELQDESGASVAAAVDVAPDSTERSRSIEIPLKVFEVEALDLARIVALRLEVNQPFELVLAKLSIGAMTAGAGCNVRKLD